MSIWGTLQFFSDISPDLLKIVEDAVLNKHPEATEALLERLMIEREKALANKGQVTAVQAPWRTSEVQARVTGPGSVADVGGAGTGDSRARERD